MPIIKALLLFCGAVPALAERAVLWLDDATEENTTSNLKVTATCCNSGGSVNFHGTNDLHCLQYFCMTINGGGGGLGGVLNALNPAAWAEEKTQCHRMGYLTWSELKAGRPDIQNFAYQDLFNDPVYFEYLIEKYMGMGALPLCGTLKGTNWNSRSVTGGTDELYSALTAKIAREAPPEPPANAPATDMDSQDKG